MRNVHLDRLDALLDARDLAAVWFARPNSFTWLTGGKNVVDRESSVGIAAAGYDGESLTVVTDSIEADRLRAEQLPDSAEVVSYPWYEGTLAAAVAEESAQPAAADFEVPEFESVETSSFRQPLSDADLDRYRDLGTDTARAVEAVCREHRATTTERVLETDLRSKLAAHGIETPVTLVGGAERAQAYRHYPPTDAVLGGYCLVSVTAVRDGLHASCTRTVAFDPPDWLAPRHDAAMTVDASALRATREVAERGGTAGDVFDAIADAYETAGYPGEWKAHHQGGATGYAGREWFATPDGDQPVSIPMAYAWNPTVQGAKSEDTALVTENGIEILTETGDWPTREVETAAGTASLSRHDLLER